MLRAGARADGAGDGPAARGPAERRSLNPAPRSCAVCGAPARPPFRAPPAEQAPDLDGRPGEPARSTLPRWIATCRSCGASAPDLAALPASAGGVVQSDAYHALRRPGPATPFLRWALILREAGDLAGAAEATLQAAWALDDAPGCALDGEGEDPAALRREAVRLWGEPADTAGALRQIDALRRAGETGGALARAAALPEAALDESSARILAFQRSRLAEGDRGRHLISSALRPPARTPHVAHGRHANGGGGFWRRLLGG